MRSREAGPGGGAAVRRDATGTGGACLVSAAPGGAAAGGDGTAAVGARGAGAATTGGAELGAADANVLLGMITGVGTAAGDTTFRARGFTAGTTGLGFAGAAGGGGAGTGVAVEVDAGGGGGAAVGACAPLPPALEGQPSARAKPVQPKKLRREIPGRGRRGGRPPRERSGGLCGQSFRICPPTEENPTTGAPGRVFR